MITCLVTTVIGTTLVRRILMILSAQVNFHLWRTKMNLFVKKRCPILPSLRCRSLSGDWKSYLALPLLITSQLNHAYV
ncbi:unnamed protein product [Protopolystoma xenopodis]|uniref:Uncharacterized protein n=1 Tax=Protopolystoma xenopodis TaxID=117903 RepID=A0A3S4ZSG0_9PLAT|nr:unnamed protein product [Protopolystoma xenopodis]